MQCCGSGYLQAEECCWGFESKCMPGTGVSSDRYGGGGMFCGMF